MFKTLNKTSPSLVFPSLIVRNPPAFPLSILFGTILALYSTSSISVIHQNEKNAVNVLAIIFKGGNA